MGAIYWRRILLRVRLELHHDVVGADGFVWIAGLAGIGLEPVDQSRGSAQPAMTSLLRPVPINYVPTSEKPSANTHMTMAITDVHFAKVR